MAITSPAPQVSLASSPASAATTIRAREIAKAVVAFALGFVAIAAIIHACIRNPLYLHSDIRSEKLAILQQWRGRAFSASFGSSHLNNGFDPRVFDDAMAGTPESTRTVNLAIGGGSQSEQRVMALEFVRGLTELPERAAHRRLRPAL